MILIARRFGFSIWLIELFRAVEQALGKREIIAEDLGYMSETVRQLVRDSGFPGMKVLEFAFDSRDTGSASDYLPHNYPVNSVAYTGTHDNETLVSWYQTVTDAERAMVRDYLYDYATPEEQLYKSMIALILRSADIQIRIFSYDIFHFTLKCLTFVDIFQILLFLDICQIIRHIRVYLIGFCIRRCMGQRTGRRSNSASDRPHQACCPHNGSKPGKFHSHSISNM